MSLHLYIYLSLFFFVPLVLLRCIFFVLTFAQTQFLSTCRPLRLMVPTYSCSCMAVMRVFCSASERVIGCRQRRSEWKLDTLRRCQCVTNNEGNKKGGRQHKRKKRNRTGYKIFYSMLVKPFSQPIPAQDVLSRSTGRCSYA